MGHIEPLVGVLRVPGAYGDDFDYAVTIRYHSPTHVELLAMHKRPSMQNVRDGLDTLRKHGITHIGYRRRRTGMQLRWRAVGVGSL